MNSYGASAKSKKRKLMRNELSLTPLSASSPSKQNQQPAKSCERMSAAELEEKKTLLPYLEKIEYINAQLRTRGVEVTEPFKKTHSRNDKSSTPHDVKEDNELVLESLSSRSEMDIEVLGITSQPSITISLLRQRYPRFCSTILTDRLRVRPMGWLLKFVEDVYDSYYQRYQENNVITSFPLFVRSHLQQSLGLSTLADQESLDLLFNLEMNREQYPNLSLFATFLRELEDEEGALFYAYMRHVAQKIFGLCLSSKEKLLPQDIARKFHRAGSIVVANHPSLSDGTQMLYLSQEACALHILKAVKLQNLQQLTEFLARHSIRGYIKAETSGNHNPTNQVQDIITLDGYLSQLLGIFRSVPEDIVHKFKYNDDGESLTLLTRLQDTIHHDEQILVLRSSLDERIRTLKSLQVECLKFEREQIKEPSRPDLRTKLFLLRNQMRSEEREIDNLRERLRNADGQVNAVWSSVLEDAKHAPTVQLSPLQNILARFVDYTKMLFHEHKLEMKLRKIMQSKRLKSNQSSSWTDQLEALQERSVVKIQRLFRQRRAWHRERKSAQAELDQRRQLKLKRKAEKELERKRLDAMRARDAERHLNRMQEKKNRDDVKQKKIHENEQAVLKKAAIAESERRAKQIQQLLVSRVFARWKRYRVVCNRIKFGRRMTLHKLFTRWKDFSNDCFVQHEAAMEIQAGFRGMEGRKQARVLRRQRDKKNQLATRNITRLLNRYLYKVWTAWVSFTALQLNIKRKFAASMTRCVHDTFLQWARFLPMRREAVMFIQRNWRGHRGRCKVSYLRHMHAAAMHIQRITRGYNGRKIANLRRQLHNFQSQGSNALLRRMLMRVLSHCFDNWKWLWERRKHIERMAQERIMRRRLWTFQMLKSYRLHRQRKRAERFRMQFEAATIIQRYFRGYWCRVAFRRTIRRHKCASKIQYCYKRYRQKWIVYEIQRKNNAAIRIQCLYRRRKAIALVTRRRNEYLWQAARRGDYYVVLRGFNSGTAWNLDEDGNSILHLACLAGSKRILKLCLRYGMDINATNNQGQSALHTMISTTHECRAELVDYMIDHGAWHECRDATGDTPLLLAASLGHADCVTTLLARAADRFAVTTSNQNAISVATSLNHVDTARILLEHGFDPNTIDPSDGATLLHECAAHGYVEITKILLQHKADPNRQDNEGNTPAIYAVYNNQYSVLSQLLAHGTSADVVNAASRSAMHMAVGKPDIIRLLADYNANINIETLDGETPLHFSCASDDFLESTKMILSYGSSVDSSNVRGNQAAHIAARAGAAATMDLLIQYSTNMNFRNFDNKNPLGEARMFNQKHVVAVIQRHYADDIKALEDADDVLRDEDGKIMPERTPEIWAKAVDQCVQLATLNEWTQCVDSETELLFYYEKATMTCTWKAPIEFQAALGSHWHVQQRVVQKEVDSTAQDEGELNAPNSPVVSYVYVNDQTGEERTTVPPIDPTRVQALIQGIDQYKMLRSRIHKVSSETAATVANYKAFWTDFTRDAQLLRQEYQAAIKIQNCYRSHLYYQRYIELKLQHKMALKLQRSYRGRMARRIAAHERRRHHCATKIQAIIRGFLTRRREKHSLYEERVEHRSRSIATINIQRCWRGMHGRYRAKKQQAMKTGPQTYFEWADARKHGTILETYQVWQEIQMTNTTGHGIFYCNHITGQCVWDKPHVWIEYDRAKFLERQQMYYYGYTTQMLHAAILLQSLFRMRKSRIYFHRLMKGVRICRTCESDYLNDPLNLTRLGNYVLYLHAIRHDYDRARPLYQRLMEYMTSRGPDIPFILRCYGLFLYVTEEEDMDNIAMLFERADKMDKPKLKFQLAFLGFFRYSQVMYPRNGQSNLNYAAALQWVYHQPTLAKEYYLRALEADPYNRRIMSLFNVLLEKMNDPDTDGAHHFMRYQATMVEEEDIIRRQEYIEKKTQEERNRAACYIQSRYRARKERKKLDRIMSMVLPKEIKFQSREDEQLYNAFHSIAEKNRNTSTIRLEQLALVYPLLGWSQQDAMDDISFATSHMEFDYPSSITWTKFQNWLKNATPTDSWETCVMDDTSIYYYNTITGISQWEKPRVHRLIVQPMIDQWEEASTETGEVYYYNPFTGESRWDNPTCNGMNITQGNRWEQVYDSNGQFYYYNSTTGETSWTIPVDSMDQWENATTLDGNIYYINSISGESVWTIPNDNNWHAIKDENGEIYYYNSKTELSQWISPWK